MTDRYDSILKKCAVAVLLLAALSCWNVSRAQTITISGTISLPNPAPASGIDFNVNAFDTAGLESEVNTPVSFSSGDTAQGYTITLPTNASSQWRILYDCTSNCDDHVDFGVYATSLPDNLSLDYSQATLMSGDVSHIGIDFQAREATTISGEVFFPSGLSAPPGGIQIHINTHDKNRPVSGYYDLVGNTVVDVAGNATSFNYTTKVVDDGSAIMVTEASCHLNANTGGECDGYIPSTFYAIPDSVHTLGGGDTLAGGMDHSGIDFDLIEAYMIAGTIALPSGTAPAGGINLDLNAKEIFSPYTYGAYERATIEAGNSSVSYLLRVPVGVSADWVVEAECASNCSGYADQTYYSASGGTTIGEQATQLPNIQDYSGLDFSLAEAYAGQIPMCDELLDDFEGQAMDLDKWFHPESSLQISGGKLQVSQKLISDDHRETYQQRLIPLLTGFPDDVQADVAVVSTDLTDSGKGKAFADVRGVFYNMFATPNPNSFKGDIYAASVIGDRGSGLEAWWEILVSTNSDFTEYTILKTDTLIAPGTLSLGTEYPVRLQYDGSTGFTFTVNGVSESASGPSNNAAAVDEFRAMSAGALPEDNMDTDPISVVATYDDVATNGILYDDFSSSQLDQGRWLNTQAKRELTGGKLRSEIVSQSSSPTTLWTDPFYEDYADSTCLRATMNLQSSSTLPSGTRGRARIEGYWYNTTYDSTSGYNGYEGNVYAQVVLEQTENGTVRAAAYAERADDPNYSSSTQLTFHVFDTSVSMDTDYVAAIELDEDNSQLLFRFENEVWAYPILTDINPPWPDRNYNSIAAQLRSGPGEVEVLFDDVYITGPDFDGDGLSDGTDPDDDDDGMPDDFENDNGLNRKDASDAGLDPDNDGLTNLEEYNAGSDINDPDSDGDEIADGLDTEPIMSNNACLGATDMDLANEMVMGDLLCAATSSITIDDTVAVMSGGQLVLIAPQVTLSPGFHVETGGKLRIHSADPCPACP